MSSQKTAAIFALVYSVVTAVFVIFISVALAIFCAYGLLSVKNVAFIILSNILFGCFGFFFTESFCEKESVKEMPYF